MRGVWAWGPATYLTARALTSWLCALWGRHEGTRGGRLLPGCQASGSGRSPTPDRPSSGPAARARYPLAVGRGGVGVGTRHRPHRARSCELALRAVGAAGGCPEGALLAWVWGVRALALSHSRPPVLRACGRGPLSSGRGCGGAGRGVPPPTPQRALLRAGFARRGGGTRAPGGAPLAWLWGVRVWALSHSQPAILRACGRGPLPTGCECGVGVGARFSLPPSPVPRFVVCGPRFTGFRHRMAVVAWHLSLSHGCGQWRVSLACLGPRVGAPRLVRSGRSRCFGQLSRRRGAFPHPRGCRPRLY